MNARPQLVPYRYGRFQIWSEPKRDEPYIVGIDTAEGKIKDVARIRASALLYRDAKPDYSAAIVIHQDSGQHVASWHGDIPAAEWPYVCAAIGLYYNTALLVPETNGPGAEVVETLARRIQYPRIYRKRLHAYAGTIDLTPSVGWTTTASTRPLLIAAIEEALISNKLFTRDLELIKELRTVEIDQNGVARAKHPHHDDRVLALGMALQARRELLYGQIEDRNPNPDDQDLPWFDRQVWSRVRDRWRRLEAR